MSATPAPPRRSLPSQESAAPAGENGHPSRGIRATVAQLAARMADLARPCNPDVIVGLPTLGMVFAAPIAQALEHRRWVPLGYSRKFWYDEALGTPVRSMTTPSGEILRLHGVFDSPILEWRDGGWWPTEG